MNRRYFFNRLTGIIVAATSPGLFLPKLIKPAWRIPEPNLVEPTDSELGLLSIDLVLLRNLEYLASRTWVIPTIGGGQIISRRAKNGGEVPSAPRPTCVGASGLEGISPKGGQARDEIERKP